MRISRAARLQQQLDPAQSPEQNGGLQQMLPLGEQQPAEHGSPQPLEPPLEPPLVEPPPDPPQLETRVRLPLSAAHVCTLASRQVQEPEPSLSWLRRQHEPEHELTLEPVEAALEAAFGPV
jgi:hypothetical protein